MNLPHFLNIRRIPFIIEPLEHVSKLLNHTHNTRTHKVKRSGHIPTSLLVEAPHKLIIRQLITSQRNRPPLIIPRIQEDFCRNRTYITTSDHLQRLPLQRHPEARRKDFTDEVRSEIIVESRRAQDSPIHLAIFGLFDQMSLDVILEDPMGHFGRVVN